MSGDQRRVGDGSEAPVASLRASTTIPASARSCRRDGVIRSKDAAADWVLERLPEEHRPVLARARANYLGEEAERWDDLLPRVRPHVDCVMHEIERLSVGRVRSDHEA